MEVVVATGTIFLHCKNAEKRVVRIVGYLVFIGAHIQYTAISRNQQRNFWFPI
jgi:hypothetical protein